MIHFDLLRKAFGLRGLPFDVVETIDDLYRTADMKVIADLVRYAAEKKALTAVIGEVGSGKTHAVRQALRTERRRGTIVIEVYAPNKHRLCFSHIAEAFADELNMEEVRPRGNRGALLIRAALLDRVDARKKILLHIDEAHRLGKQLLHSLKEMWEWRAGTDYQALFGVVLSGWPDLMSRYRLLARDVWQRLAAGNILEMGLLSDASVTGYIEHRMNRAGCRKKVFKPEAIAVLSREARTPLRINELATRMLIEAARLESPVVDERIARRIVERRTASLRERMQEAGLTTAETARRMKERFGSAAPGRSVVVEVLKGNYRGSSATNENAKRLIELIIEETTGNAQTQKENTA